MDQDVERAQGRAPGRPRSTASKLAVLRAALDLLHEVSLRDLTIEQIAERAKVGKATIYKWWPSKAFVALEALLSSIERAVTTADTGSAQQDFLLQLKALIRFYGSPAGHIFRQFIVEGQADDAFAKAYREQFLEPRRAAVRVIWRRGVERGEIDEKFDCELVIDMIYAPLVYRLLLGHQPFGAEEATKLTEAIFGGLHPSIAKTRKAAATSRWRKYVNQI